MSHSGFGRIQVGWQYVKALNPNLLESTTCAWSVVTCLSDCDSTAAAMQPASATPHDANCGRMLAIWTVSDAFRYSEDRQEGGEDPLGLDSSCCSCQALPVIPLGKDSVCFDLGCQSRHGILKQLRVGFHCLLEEIGEVVGGADSGNKSASVPHPAAGKSRSLGLEPSS